jgi:hypothetical protein
MLIQTCRADSAAAVLDQWRSSHEVQNYHTTFIPHLSQKKEALLIILLYTKEPLAKASKHLLECLSRFSLVVKTFWHPDSSLTLQGKDSFM